MNRVYEMARERLSRSSKIVLYGASLAALGILEEYRLPVAYLVDDTPGMAGKQLPNGLCVHPVERLAKETKGNIYIVISAWTQNAILTISERLQGMGFLVGEDFVDCSILHFDSITAKLQARLDFKTELETFSACRLWCLNCHATSVSAVAGTWLFVELLRYLNNGRVPGNVAECGVYQGGNAFISLMLSPALRARKYQLFDSFSGFPTFSSVDPTTRRDHFRDVSLTAITARFAAFSNVEIHKGYFNKTFPQLTSADYALVYIDCDLYESTLECLKFFYPRLRPGGILLLHDYWLPEEKQAGALGLDLYRGVKKACAEFLGNTELSQVLSLPETTHGLLVKK